MDANWNWSAVQHDDAPGAEPWSGEAQRHRDRGLELVAENSLLFTSSLPSWISW